MLHYHEHMSNVQLQPTSPYNACCQSSGYLCKLFLLVINATSSITVLHEALDSINVLTLCLV